MEKRIYERLDEIQGAIEKLQGQVSSLEGEVKGLQKDVALLQGARSNMRWIAALICSGVVLGALYAGKSVVKEIAREVVREEFQYRATYTQYGTFSRATRIADSPPTFSWKLRKSLDPNSVVSIDVEALEPIPGIGIVSQMGADGASCTMTLYGSDEAINAMPKEVPARVVIGLR